MRPDIADEVGYRFAALVSGNNQPHMSGDPRARIAGSRRRQFDDACAEVAEMVNTRIAAAEKAADKETARWMARVIKLEAKIAEIRKVIA
jgi:hypothetical protein